MAKYLLLFFVSCWSLFSFANDECANAITLTPGTTCNYTNASFNGMTMNGAGPSCETSSLQDLWFRFTATDATMRVALSATSGLNHGFEIIQGGCGGTVLYCVNNNGFGNGEASINTIYAPGQVYYVRVFNASASFSTASFGICLQNYPSPPNDLCANAITLTPGTTCNPTAGTLSGALNEGAAPSCAATVPQDVWYRFTATDSTMRIFIPAVTGLNPGFEIFQGSCGGPVFQCVNNNGFDNSESYFNTNFIPGQVYYIRVFNASGSLTALSFQICVQTYPSPVNDLCANAITLTPGTACNPTSGTFSGAMMNGAMPSCGTSVSQDVWYKFTATDSTMRIAIPAVTGLNPGFEIFQGSCGGPVFQCVNNNGFDNGESYFNTNFIPGQVYYIRVFNASGALTTLSFQICVQTYQAPANDWCSSAITLTPGTSCNYTSGTFSGAMMNGAMPACGNSTTQDVWYKFTATDSIMRIAIAATTGINPGFEIIQGSCNGPVLQCMNIYGFDNGETYFNNIFVPGQVYYVRVFNASGSLTALSFQICVQTYPAPANDWCSSAITLTPGTSCNYTSGTFSGAMMNGAMPACGNSTTQDVWYKFTATDSTMRVSLSAQSNLNHGFEIIQGSCNGPVWQCVNNSSAGFGESYFNNNFIPGQVYYVRVFNNGSLSTLPFQICVQSYSTPANDQCVNATTLTPGTSCNYVNGTFSGAMMNGGTPACGTFASQDVWYKFTATDSTMRVLLSAETNLNHGFEIIQGSCNGPVWQCVNNSSAGFNESYFNNNFIPGQVYYVRVLNISGTLSTLPFQICVQSYPTPSNDRCVNATTIVPGTSCNYINGTFSGAMMNGGTPACGTSASQDVWYKFVATDSTMRILLSAELNLNHGFEIIQGSCNGPVWQCVNNSSAGFNESYFNNNFIPGQVYYVRVFNNGSLSTLSFQICIQRYPTPYNDQCANAIELTPGNTCSNISGTFSGAMMNGGIPSCAPSSSQDAWYKFTATATGMTIQLAGISGLNHGFQVFEGGCNGTEIACRNQSGAGFSESLALTGLTVGQTYYVRVLNTASALSTTSFSICLVGTPLNACTPSVVITASETTICQGQSVTFTATPTHGGSPSYQWKMNGTNVGTNSSTYTTSTLSNGAMVSCVMVSSTSCAFPLSVTSNTITMNVTPLVASTFTQIPAICPGGSFTLPSVSNNGITGYWNPAINNMATTTYTFTPDGSQCAATATMTVTVNAGTVPAFNAIPPICSGQSFTLPATSTNGISGTWSPAINNMATTTYTFTPNPGGCTATTTMTVTVNSTSTMPAFNQIPAICAGGTFTLPTTSINGINGTWSPAVNNTATTTYTFTPSAGQCASTTTMTVTVNSASTTPTFNQVPAICTGGTFTLPTTSTNGINGTWSPAVNNMATTTYTFTPSSGQCATTTTMTVTVTAASTTPTFNQIPAICTGSTFTLPTTSTNGINGTWSPAVNNMATTTYTFTPAAGQCATTATMTVTVTAASTTPMFNQIPAICTGGTFTLPTTSTNGINGTWSPAVNNTATTTYTFTPSSGQCATTATMTVTVTAASTTPTFNQIPAICTGGTFTLPTTSTNGINGTWSPAVNNMATTTYTFTPAAGQCATTTTMTVTVNAGVIPSFTPVNAICSGESFTLPAISNDGISGTWSPAINNMATTTYTFTPTSGQCVQTTTMTVAVNSVNAAVTTQGNTITASATGAIYHWIDCSTNQPINGATNASFTPTQNGSYAVVVTQNGCTDTSTCIAITTVGVEALTQNGWIIYPNPVSELLVIETTEAAVITITDMAGKTILQQDLKLGNNPLNVSLLTPGMYFIQSASGAAVKFVKQ